MYQIIFILLSFLLIPVLISIPYVLSIYDISLLNAYFESVSGFTTTGFSIIEKLGMEIAEIAGMDIGQNYGHTGSSYRKGNAHDWFYRETGCIQYLVEVGYTPDHDYGEGLLVESDHMGDVLESNLDAFYHLLMRASGQNKENVLNESVDGNQVNGIVSDAITKAENKWSEKRRIIKQKNFFIF